jgi:hypothetical protein
MPRGPNGQCYGFEDLSIAQIGLKAARINMASTRTCSGTWPATLGDLRMASQRTRPPTEAASLRR